MFPTLEKGDVLEVEAAGEIHPGDIVVFRRGNVLVCHRVTGDGPPGTVLTAGERSQEPGDPVPRSDVLAKVCAIHRRGRRLVPNRPAKPTPAAWLRLLLDRSLTAWNTTWRGWAEAAWERVSRGPRGRALLSGLIRRGARVHVFRQASCSSFSALSVVHRLTLRLDDIESLSFVRDGPTADPVRLEIRLGPYRLGAYDSISGEVFLHPLVENLGLGQALYEPIRHLKAASTPKDRPGEPRLGPPQ